MATPLSAMSSPSDRGENIILTKNSGIFSLAELRAYKKREKRNGPWTIFIGDYWINDVHKSRLQSVWGQYINEFPPFVQDRIKELFPEHPESERITFDIYRRVRLSFIQDLKMSGEINVIEADVEAEIQGDFMVFKNKKGTVHKIANGKDAIVYNTVMKPRGNEAIVKLTGIDLPEQSELYPIPTSKPPKCLIVFGNGLSAMWTKEQFPPPYTDIRYILKPGGKMPSVKRTEHIKIPSEHIYSSDNVIPLPAKAIMVLDDRDPKKRFLLAHAADYGIDLMDLKDNDYVIFDKSGRGLFMGLAYNAIGFEPHKELVAKIPDKNKKNLHPERLEPGREPVHVENLPLAALMDNETRQTAVFRQDVGLSLHDQTQTIKLDSLFIRPEDFEVLQKYMAGKGVVLGPTLFKELLEFINTRKVQDVSDFGNPIEVMVRLFSKHLPASISEREFASQIKKFENALQELFMEKQIQVEELRRERLAALERMRRPVGRRDPTKLERIQYSSDISKVRARSIDATKPPSFTSASHLSSDTSTRAITSAPARGKPKEKAPQSLASKVRRSSTMLPSSRHRSPTASAKANPHAARNKKPEQARPQSLAQGSRHSAAKLVPPAPNAQQPSLPSSVMQRSPSLPSAPPERVAKQPIAAQIRRLEDERRPLGKREPTSLEKTQRSMEIAKLRRKEQDSTLSSRATPHAPSQASPFMPAYQMQQPPTTSVQPSKQLDQMTKEELEKRVKAIESALNPLGKTAPSKEAAMQYRMELSRIRKRLHEINASSRGPSSHFG